jgi:T-complex protein 1 subunit eta
LKFIDFLYPLTSKIIITFFTIFDFSEARDLLIKCAATAMNSKLIGSHKDFFAPIVVDAVLALDDDKDISLVGIKKETGGSMEVCF